ncbi:hypothetical protein N8A98_06690 [Devosia neptuniae]|uniref:Uncharacterized protein n=1 Tax=Devosia neptuniae TaxID=191302 RepID=A0ABY6CGC1_9HYPH|nr:hypothetical protein [Devosia neptuniae]UXN70868.1 hypothetical protein N8A98_06690 [Devosia neptuniae]
MIWNIKSKTLRAIVAWLFAGLAAVVVLALLPVAIVWLAAAGIAAGLRAAVADKEWWSLFKPWWAAARGKEAV